MNKQRRAILAKIYDNLSEIRDLLEEVQCKEQDAFDNLPEGIQESERGQEIEDNAYQLDEAVGYLADALQILEEIDTGTA